MISSKGHITLVWKSTEFVSALYLPTAISLKDGLSGMDESAKTLLAKATRGPPSADASATTSCTTRSARAWRPSASPVPSAPSAAASWSRVAPPAPAATRLSATWRESGEKAALPAAPSGLDGEEMAEARRNAKRVWWAMETGEPDVGGRHGWPRSCRTLVVMVFLTFGWCLDEFKGEFVMLRRQWDRVEQQEASRVFRGLVAVAVQASSSLQR
jgi:hypothetical protein